MEAFGLGRAFTTTFGGSIYALFRMAYPWAFNLDIPEGKHLHPDDFRQMGKWNKRKGGFAWKMADHRLRRHLGIEMNEEEEIPSEKLLRKKISQFLEAQDVTCIRDLLWREGLGGMMSNLEECKRPSAFLKWRYPWAFDLETAEGDHLHSWDLDKIHIFGSVDEERTALLHEARVAGIEVRDLTRRMSEAWLRARNLGCLYRRSSRLKTLERLFPGMFSQADFRNQSSHRWGQASPYKKIGSTLAGSTFYGVVNVGNTRIYVSEEFAGQVFRQESSTHAVIYRKMRRAGGGMRYFPYKALSLPSDLGSRRYHRADIIDFDIRVHPILPPEIRTRLAELDVLPQELPSGIQSALMNYLSASVDGQLDHLGLREYLIQIGRIRPYRNAQ